MDTKERVPDYRMSCTLKQLEDALKELSDEVKQSGIAQIDFYYTNKTLEKEFKTVLYEYLGISRF